MESKKKQTPPGVSKRQAVRLERARKERRQRLMVILGIGLVALLVVGIIALPFIQRTIATNNAANAPVGDIVEITPVERPQVDGRAMGDPNAPVQIEVYEDFQCPACRTYSDQVEPRIAEELVATGQVYYVFRHYPFIDDRSAIKESDQAANASMCAAEQGRFWDYHDMLFANWNGENEGAFRDNRLVAFAETIGLDMTQFNACFEANRFESEIEADLNKGTSLGVVGTPSVFVNGEQVAPGFVPTFEQIQEAMAASQ